MKLVYIVVLYCLCISSNAQPVSESVSNVTETLDGGLSDADVNDPHIKDVAAFALSEIDRRQNSAFKQALVQIVSAKTQVVGGTLYHLRLEIGASNCRKGKDDATSECTLKAGSNIQVCDVKVWDKPWLPTRQVTELSCSAKTSRRKRETLVGGLADADVSEEGVKNAVDFALTEIDKTSNSAYKQALVQILSAQRQVVAGTLYHLQFEVGDSNCDKRSSGTDSECSVKDGSNHQVCSVKVWDRPWLNKKEVTHLHCSAKSARRRRQTIPGGLADADVNEEGVKKAADFALTEIEKTSNSAYKQTLVQILSAKKQVVAGFLYHLQLEVGESSCDKGSNKPASECSLREGSNNQICTVKVWDRPWLKSREVTQVDCSAKSARRRRTAPDITPPGGLFDADTDNVDIKSAAAFAVTEINNRQNSDDKLILVQILGAQSQIVAGSLHYLKLEIGESNCSKANSGATSECTLRENSNNQVCDVKIWDRPWLNKREITEIQCSSKSDRTRRAALPDVRGVGLQGAKIDDNVKNAAAFAVSEIDKQQDSEYKLVLVKIIFAQTQVVAGRLYNFKLEIGQSNCTKGNDVVTAQCTVQDKSRNQICIVLVYEVLWENRIEASNIKCIPK
ncbi:kininogen-1-like [Schistocerca gregaria]|uniref:kininogen-1-like n=1 Tax=Schistocerca gregaria TaxID=7010 RepID=UPI00211E2189|nr:kininogen-1-like [Schistocerca gregaria]